MNFTVAEHIGHTAKNPNCKCVLCVGVSKLAPDYDEAFLIQEQRDAERQFQIQEKLLTMGND